MKKSARLIYLVFMTAYTLHFSSCVPAIYSTTGQNVPLFREKGEVTLSGAYGSVDEGDGIALQGAAAFTDKFAMGASFYSLWGGSLNEDSWKGNGNYFELVAGRYGTFVKKNPLFIYEAFGGFGYGAINNKTADGSAVNVRFIKPFLQPSLGIRHKIVEIAATPRISLLHYTSQEARASDPQQTEEAKAFFSDNKTKLTLEPGVTFRLGYKSIKFQFQYNFTTLGDSNSTGDIDVSGIRDEFVSVGLHYNFGKKWER